MNIYDFNLTGQPNEYGGLVFRIQHKGNRYIFDFLVQKLTDRGIVQLTIRMSPDRNHKRPHIHIDKWRQTHVASIALDNATILKGKLSSKEYRLIQQWVEEHRSKLLELWRSASESPDYTQALDNVLGTWEYNGVAFNGSKPKNLIYIDDVILWYNGNLFRSSTNDGHIKVVCSKDLCVYFPKGSEDKQQLFLFESQGCQVRQNVKE